MNLVYVILFFAILGMLITLKIIFYRLYPFVEQYVFTNELDLLKRYGNGIDTWVLITGPSSGMGERFR